MLTDFYQLHILVSGLSVQANVVEKINTTIYLLHKALRQGSASSDIITGPPRQDLGSEYLGAQFVGGKFGQLPSYDQDILRQAVR